MAKITMSPTKVIILYRISFANIWEPKSINGSDEKYSVSLLIPKEDKATLEKIQKAVEAAKEDEVGRQDSAQSETASARWRYRPSRR